MSMPPPVDDNPNETQSPSPGAVPRIDLRAIGAKLRENDIGNLIFSLGAGLVAFNEARKFRKQKNGDQNGQGN